MLKKNEKYSTDFITGIESIYFLCVTNQLQILKGAFLFLVFLVFYTETWREGCASFKL